jgi:glycosyltransferase involved in cell wall biosynthesis
MTKLFAAVNGEILESLEENTTPTYTRIHYLLIELKNFEDMEVMAIRFHLLSTKGLGGILYNNILKTVVALRSALLLILYRPLVYFAYPHSLTTIQNRMLFRFCRMLHLKIILDIHDTIEQGEAVGSSRSALNEYQEAYYIKNATIVLALNCFMWEHLKEKYGIMQDIKVILVPNAYDEKFQELFPEKYKSVPNRCNICYIGGLSKNRGVDMLFEACSKLHDIYPCLKLYLYGPYGYGFSGELKNKIKESDFALQSEVPRKDMPKSLLDMDILMMTYNPQEKYMDFSSPTKIFEYLGTGKSIMCSKCRSLLDIGKQGAIIYFDYNESDLASGMEMLITNPSMRENISEKIMSMRAEHSWKKRAEVIYEAIKSS